MCYSGGNDMNHLKHDFVNNFPNRHDILNVKSLYMDRLKKELWFESISEIFRKYAMAYGIIKIS